VFSFLTSLGTSHINAISVAHVTTNLEKAMVYHMLRKRHFTHRDAMDFIQRLTPQNYSELKSIILKENNSRVRNSYFNARKRGLTHNKAMNAALMTKLGL